MVPDCCPEALQGGIICFHAGATQDEARHPHERGASTFYRPRSLPSRLKPEQSEATQEVVDRLMAGAAALGLGGRGKSFEVKMMQTPLLAQDERLDVECRSVAIIPLLPQ